MSETTNAPASTDIASTAIKDVEALAAEIVDVLVKYEHDIIGKAFTIYSEIKAVIARVEKAL